MRTTWLLALVSACVSVTALSDDSASDEQWHSLFNGKDLSGWTVKIAKHPLNENYADTFRVEDGVIKVSYDQYDKFEERFGHIWTPPHCQALMAERKRCSDIYPAS